MPQWIELRQNGTAATLALKGTWRLAHLLEISKEAEALEQTQAQSFIIDGSSLEEIDTSGAMTAFELISGWGGDPKQTKLENVSPTQTNILKLTQDSLGEPGELHVRDDLGTLANIGKDSINLYGSMRIMLDFIGKTFVECLGTIAHPSRFRFKEFCVQLETCGYRAIPIVLLVTFLIGIVIAYLSGIQIEKYGANIFIVDGVTLAMCRELSPILVAIIVAGRSGSAFTAQIGTMKLNEEVDAMATMDLSPMRVLVLPRIFALMAVMPLLVFLGDIAGIAGGMVIADLRLGVTGATFIDRMHAVLLPKSIIVGMVKAPVFAYFVAAIGCRMGLNVENNAQSVGSSTTSTVVQSIVMVILLNAGFAIVFSELKI